MNKELSKKPPERKRPDPELAEPKLSFKEIVVSIAVILGGILGTLIMIAVLVGIVVIIIFWLKTLISALQS